MLVCTLLIRVENSLAVSTLQQMVVPGLKLHTPYHEDQNILDLLLHAISWQNLDHRGSPRLISARPNVGIESVGDSLTVQQ